MTDEESKDVEPVDPEVMAYISMNRALGKLSIEACIRILNSGWNRYVVEATTKREEENAKKATTTAPVARVIAIEGPPNLGLKADGVRLD
jgi:hypothetical protein